MIYTTYYARLKKIDTYENDIVMAVSRTHPTNILVEADWGKTLGNFAGDLLDYEEFLNNVISQPRNKEVFKLLYTTIHDGENDVYMCCYEKDDTTCHRSIIRDIFNREFSKEFGIVIKEYEGENDI